MVTPSGQRRQAKAVLVWQVVWKGQLLALKVRELRVDTL